MQNIVILISGRGSNFEAILRTSREENWESACNARIAACLLYTSLLETHVFDWSGSAYGRIVKVEFVERLRGEKKFSGLDELKAAIESDADHARRILGCVRPQANVPLQGMNP